MQGSAFEVLTVFLRLGLTSFGGPVAHLGYFREELVRRRRWIDEAGYADLVALCQFIPGPASSQVGFCLGVLRAGGLAGGFAAWAGFTLPSAVLLVICALGAAVLDGPVAGGVLHGLKLVAVAVVAQAVWGMGRSLAPDRTRVAIVIGAMALVIGVGGPAGQVLAIALGAAAGAAIGGAAEGAGVGRLRFPVTVRGGVIALVLFLVLLVMLPALAMGSAWPTLRLFDAFYRAGALVFGGGHVVLPLLRAEVVDAGWVASETFLAGYGLTQAVPGPLFTFAAYLGAVMQTPPAGVTGAAIALIAVFLPGLLLVYGLLPFWDRLRGQAGMQALMRGANAAVVGVLAAALYDPVWTGAILGPRDFLLVAAGFLALTVWAAPPWLIVAGLALAGALRGMV